MTIVVHTMEWSRQQLNNALKHIGTKHKKVGNSNGPIWSGGAGLSYG